MECLRSSLGDFQEAQNQCSKCPWWEHSPHPRTHPPPVVCLQNRKK